MDYKKCKELKDAGYPQKEGKYICHPDYEESWSIKECEDTNCYSPTLSFLIEACGDGFEQLWNVTKDECADGHKWEAHTDGYCMVGETPEIAVANLWLALNKSC